MALAQTDVLVEGSPDVAALSVTVTARRDRQQRTREG